MSREVRLSDVVGKRVFDIDGRSIGRIEEMLAEISLHASGNDYVVVEIHVGTYGALEALAGSRVARYLIERVGRFVRHRHHRVPWEKLDLTNPERPVLRCRAEELPG